MIANKIGSAESPYLLMGANASGRFVVGGFQDAGVYFYFHRVKSRSFSPSSSQFGYNNSPGAPNLVQTPSGSFLAAPYGSGFQWWTRSGNFFSLSQTVGVGSTTLNAVAMSADGNYLAAVSNADRKVFAKSSGSFSSVTTANSTSSTSACAMSSTGLYAAFGGSSPMLQIQSRSGSGTSAAYQQMTIATQPPAGAVRSLAFSPDDQYLYVLHNSAPWITVYKLTAGVYVKEPDINSANYPVSITDNTSNSIVMAPSGNAMAVTAATSGNTRVSFYTIASGSPVLRSSFESGSNVQNNREGTWTPKEDTYITGKGTVLFFSDNTYTSFTNLGDVPIPTGYSGSWGAMYSMPLQ